MFANSGDPDQMPHSVASDLGLHCLPITLLWVSRLQWVNRPWHSMGFPYLALTFWYFGCNVMFSKQIHLFILCLAVYITVSEAYRIPNIQGV